MKTCSFLIALSIAPLSGQEDVFTLDWSSFSGGGHSAFEGGGEFSVEGTLGQFSGGAVPSGQSGEFSVSGGYWTFTLNEPLDLGITMQFNGSTVTLTWDDSAGIPVLLESSADLELWVPVQPQPWYPPFPDASARRRFYRLMPVP